MKIKCADWCGYGCTQEGYDQALRLAKGVAKKLGKGWNPRVNENLGWHPSVISACERVKVHFDVRNISGRGFKYTAFLGVPGQGGGIWVESDGTPEGAVEAVIRSARASVRRHVAMVTNLPKIRGKVCVG